MNDLTGIELNLAVAQVLGKKARIVIDEFVLESCGDAGIMFSGCVIDSPCEESIPTEFSPSTNWSQCGPLIEEYRVDISYDFDDANDKPEKAYFALIHDENKPIFGHRSCYERKSQAFGPTAQIAVCRAIVAAEK